MAVPVPFSPAYALLLLALPAVWLLGRAIAGVLSGDRAVRPALAAGLSLCAWLLAVHGASLIARSLRVGLPAGTLLAAAAGVGAEIARRRGEPDRPHGSPPSSWMPVGALLAVTAMAPLALRFHFHDEILLTGHLSIAAELQNGIYPPRHLTFPDTPLRYHYGFDLVSASLGALLHLRLDLAIDVATLGLFVLAWCLFWTLGERFAGRTGACLAPVIALFAGGLPFACDNAGASLVDRVLTVCSVGARYVNPPVPSYFFQHPWSLGIPVGLTALLVFTSRESQSERARLAALCACLVALSFSQITFFAGCLPSFVVAETFAEGGPDLRRGVRMLGVALASLVAAKLLGGFFASAPGLPGLAFSLHAGFGATPSETLRWNAQTFGVLVPIALLGFLAMRRDRLVFALLSFGSVAVVNAVRYEGSDDILKFATLATLMLAIPAAASLAAWLPQPAGAPKVSAWNTAAALALVAHLCLSGFVFVLFATATPSRLADFLRLAPMEPTPAEARAIDWLRARVRPGELVYRNAARTYAFAQWGGLPQPWIQWTAAAFGFPPDRIAARQRLLQDAPAAPETYAAEGFRFFVLDLAATEDERLRAAAARWIAERRARRVATFDELWVIEIGR
jgi:hypothetical protein